MSESPSSPAADLTPVHDFAQARREVLQKATEFFNRSPDWGVFYREILGVGGVARRLITNSDLYVEFEQSEEHAEILKMLATLRNQRGRQQEEEKTRVITVRLPECLHESLLDEAENRGTSMNKLCISKLLQVVDAELLPAPKAKSKSKLKRDQPTGNNRLGGSQLESVGAVQSHAHGSNQSHAGPSHGHGGNSPPRHFGSHEQGKHGFE